MASAPGGLGDLLITMRADIATLQSDLGKAQRLIETQSRKMQGAFNGVLAGIKSLVPAISAVQIGRFLVNTIGNAIKLGDELGTLAEKTGIAGSALSQLRYASEKADVPFELLADSLSKMQRNIAQANDGNKQAISTFRALGLSVADLNSVSADRALELIADRIAAITNVNEQAQASTDAFGKAGAGLLPLLSQGAEGIRKLREEAVRLGASLTDDQIKQLGAADDAVKKLGFAWDGFATTLTARVAPALADTFEYLRKITSQSARDELFRINVEINGGTPVAQLTGPGSLQARKKELEEFIRLEELFNKASDRSKKPTSTGPTTYKPGGTDTLLDAARVQAEAFQKAIQGADRDLNQFANNLGNSVNGDSIFSADDLYALINAERDAAEAAIEGRDALVSAARDAIDPTREITRRYTELKQAIEATIATLPEGSKKIAELQQLIGDLATKQAEEIRGTATDLTAFADQAARNMQDAFAEFLFDPFQGGLRGMLTGFVGILRRMVAEAAAAEIFKNLFGEKKGGGGLGGFLGGLFSGLFGGGKATGGPVSGGMSYLVGEKGPELLTMGRGTSGSITPNNKLGGGGMTLAPVYNFNGTGVSAEQLLMIMARNNQDLARKFSDGNRRAGLPAPRF